MIQILCTKRWLLRTCGTLLIALGIIALVIPIVPTSPFLILAAACYVRSSPLLYEKLLANRFCGKLIRNYREKGTFSWPQKIAMVITLFISMSISLFLFVPNVAAKIIIATFTLLTGMYIILMNGKPKPVPVTE